MQGVRIGIISGIAKLSKEARCDLFKTPPETNKGDLIPNAAAKWRPFFLLGNAFAASSRCAARLCRFWKQVGMYSWYTGENTRHSDLDRQRRPVCSQNSRKC
jgi:hypothetical protein